MQDKFDAVERGGGDRLPIPDRLDQASPIGGQKRHKNRDPDANMNRRDIAGQMMGRHKGEERTQTGCRRTKKPKHQYAYERGR